VNWIIRYYTGIRARGESSVKCSVRVRITRSTACASKRSLWTSHLPTSRPTRLQRGRSSATPSRTARLGRREDMVLWWRGWGFGVVWSFGVVLSMRFWGGVTVKFLGWCGGVCEGCVSVVAKCECVWGLCGCGVLYCVMLTSEMFISSMG